MTSEDYESFCQLIDGAGEVDVPDVGALVCRPLLPAPNCRSPRCVAICVCATGLTWSPAGYEERDEDDATDVDEDEEKGEFAVAFAPRSSTALQHAAAAPVLAAAACGEPALEVSLWDMIDELADYESDAEPDVTREADLAEETTPEVTDVIRPPLRKRYLAQPALACPPKHGRFGADAAAYERSAAVGCFGVAAR
ncbi:hypothetical protein KFE25_003518 [Diacronema lutheri]|uniref:Uncharacterized protein n=1 Tax=Diacronema lutheri TaxID=2081491 RepID=A0A8J5XS69_DIALT|nr:hypothetical protein KFE25_003518 [Diacronema lutheri]